MEKLFKVGILLESKYKWGSGISREDSQVFKKEVYERLAKSEKLNYKFVESDDRAISPSIYGNGEKRLYLHPMEFAGYMTENELNEVIRILNEDCPDEVVKVIRIHTKAKVDATTIDELKKVLEERREMIKDELRKQGRPAMNTMIGVVFPSRSRVTKEPYELQDYNYKFLSKLYDEISN